MRSRTEFAELCTDNRIQEGENLEAGTTCTLGSLAGDRGLSPCVNKPIVQGGVSGTNEG